MVGVVTSAVGVAVALGIATPVIAAGLLISAIGMAGMGVSRICSMEPGPERTKAVVVFLATLIVSMGVGRYICGPKAPPTGRVKPPAGLDADPAMMPYVMKMQLPSLPGVQNQGGVLALTASQGSTYSIPIPGWSPWLGGGAAGAYGGFSSGTQNILDWVESWFADEKTNTDEGSSASSSSVAPGSEAAAGAPDPDKDDDNWSYDEDDIYNDYEENRTTPGGRRVTDHGQDQINDRFDGDYGHIDNILDNPTATTMQADGGKVTLYREPGGGNAYSVIVEGEGGIVTAINNLKWTEVMNLGRNYGFSFWGL